MGMAGTTVVSITLSFIAPYDVWLSLSAIAGHAQPGQLLLVNILMGR